MVILGIDYGERRIGLAITDAEEIIASPLKTLPNDAKLFDELSEIVKERKVGEIVVGIPYNMNGSLGPAGEKVLQFAEQLRERLGVPVDTIDERLTTVQAERAMLRHDMSRARRRSRVDEMAAQILLQSHVDARKRKK